MAWENESERHRLARKNIKTIGKHGNVVSYNPLYHEYKRAEEKYVISLIQEWNEGKIPETLFQWEELLERTNYELGSGYWYFNPVYVEELRTIKVYALNQIDFWTATKEGHLYR